MKGPVLGVIPARLASSRLPRKPLHLILGRPLLQWVWERVATMSVFDDLVIATDAEEIESLAHSLGARVIRTEPDHPSGTDRVAEVAGHAAFSDHSIIVNVQGDEPLMHEAHLSAAIELVRAGWDVGTCATPVQTQEARSSADVVKVVRRSDGGALYFSRAGIPYQRDGKPRPEDLAAAPFLRHIGVYAYRREALFRWVQLPPSPLEEIERLEQLRALEAGIGIGIAIVDGAHPGVDTAADVIRMESLLRERGISPTSKTTGALSS